MKSFLKIVLIIPVLLLFLVLVKPLFAMDGFSMGMDTTDAIWWKAATNRDTTLDFEFTRDSGDQILGRYFFAGDGSWRPATQDPHSGATDYIFYNRTFSSPGNYPIGGAWVYRNTAGQVKVFTDQSCLYVFNRYTGLNFGKVTMAKNASDQRITVSGTTGEPYLGAAIGSMYGNNYNYVPVNIWRWSLVGINPSGECREFGGTDYTTPVSTWTDCLSAARQGLYESAFPLSYTFLLQSASFNPNEGNNTYATFDLSNTTVYRRNTPKGTCGGVPPISVTASGQYFGKSQCEARVDTKKGWCLLNPALGQINPNNPDDPINTWKWSYFSVGNGSAAPQSPTAAPTVAPTPIPTISPKPTLIPTSTPTPKPRLNCQGQYFGKPQCDVRASATYGSGGTCQLNPALGTINPSNPNDPVNYWKWSYCFK